MAPNGRVAVLSLQLHSPQIQFSYQFRIYFNPNITNNLFNMCECIFQIFVAITTDSSVFLQLCVFISIDRSVGWLVNVFHCYCCCCWCWCCCIFVVVFLSYLLLWDANEMMMIVRDGGRSSGLSMRQFQIHIYCYLFSVGVYILLPLLLLFFHSVDTF